MKWDKQPAFKAHAVFCLNLEKAIIEIIHETVQSSFEAQ